MRIGVVTVQDSNNFGSFLQGYALLNVLQDMGHEVVFLRTRSKRYLRRNFYHVIPRGREWVCPVAFLKSCYAGRKKYCRFQKELSVFNVMETYDAKKLDLVILGSDEIWNARKQVFRSPVFYGAGMFPVMAYAVSIGNADARDMSCIDSAYFLRIDPILARDVYTADYLRAQGIEAPVVCDPTLLVDKSLFFREYFHPLMEKPFLLVYTYGLPQEAVKSIRAFAEQRGLRVLSACFPFPWCDGNLECTALDFCSVLEKAEYVFTSTFHGTIFSIINHKQFVSLPQSRKVNDLLDSLELSSRLIYVEELNVDILEKKLEAGIDYARIDQTISCLRKNSLNMLKEGVDRIEGG